MDKNITNFCFWDSSPNWYGNNGSHIKNKLRFIISISQSGVNYGGYQPIIKQRVNGDNNICSQFHPKIKKGSISNGQPSHFLWYLQSSESLATRWHHLQESHTTNTRQFDKDNTFTCSSIKLPKSGQWENSWFKTFRGLIDGWAILSMYLTPISTIHILSKKIDKS